MDKIGTKPLHQMSRMDAIAALQQTRGELVDAKQRIKDLEGEVQALIEAGDQSPSHDVLKVGRSCS